MPEGMRTCQAPFHRLVEIEMASLVHASAAHLALTRAPIRRGIPDAQFVALEQEDPNNRQLRHFSEVAEAIDLVLPKLERLSLTRFEAPRRDCERCVPFNELMLQRLAVWAGPMPRHEAHQVINGSLFAALPVLALRSSRGTPAPAVAPAFRLFYFIGQIPEGTQELDRLGRLRSVRRRAESEKGEGITPALRTEE